MFSRLYKYPFNKKALIYLFCGFICTTWYSGSQYRIFSNKAIAKNSCSESCLAAKALARNAGLYLPSYLEKDEGLRRHTARYAMCNFKRTMSLSFLHNSTYELKDSKFKSILLSEKTTRHLPSFSTCGVVSNSGRMIGSNLGAHIDANEAVFRLNSAPTTGFERDVGRKTFLRLFDSLVPVRERDIFLNGSVYSQNVSMLVGWDDVDDMNIWLHDCEGEKSSKVCVEKSNHAQFLNNLYEFLQLKRHANLRVINPKFIKNAWEFVWRFSPHNGGYMISNSPSSGTLAIFLALHICDVVNAYEMIPTTRSDALFHYFDHETRFFDIRRSFFPRQKILGPNWHPVVQEKLLIQLLHNGSDEDLYRTGIASLPGTSQLKNCQDYVE